MSLPTPASPTSVAARTPAKIQPTLPTHGPVQPPQKSAPKAALFFQPPLPTHSTIDVSTMPLLPSSEPHSPALPTSSSVSQFWTALRGPGRRGQLEIRCFILTFFAYASTFLLLKPLSLIKHDISEDLGVSLPSLGWLDVACLLPLAICEILLPRLGEHAEPRAIISVSLAVTAAITLLFFVTKHYTFYIIILALSGMAQSVVFPFCVKALSLCYIGGNRSTVFGIWGSCMFLGGLLGHVFANLGRSLFGWRFVFLLPSLLVGLMAVVVHWLLLLPSGTSASAGLRQRPPSRNPPKVLKSTEMLLGNDKNSQDSEVFLIQSVPVSRELSLREISSIKSIKELAFTYFSVNLLRYTLYMWLPLFLSRETEHSTSMSGWISVAFELGCLIGSPFLGALTDRSLAGRKLLAAQISLLVSALAILFFYLTVRWPLFSVLFLFLAGAGNGGTDLILSGTAAIDLGEKDDCVSSIAGFISGFGAFGAVAQAPLIALSAHFTGRNSVFYVMLCLAVLPLVAVQRARAAQAATRREPKLKACADTKKSAPPRPPPQPKPHMPKLTSSHQF
eukprot:m.166195 g.166195  ORF g.166195 m.166195 type:complete len:562 (-) comp53141_c0_seq1:27-1712(-)